ncbi:CHASE4 domain-containing protein [Aeoliella sp. SH292]|uniref:CHASE4 domain-containing protein n=1 Tax=Aeoliella sp. SH292 TaxID=3454464 RepID=UPI003F94D018
MSLRNRVAALLVALSIALVAIMCAAQELVVMPTFEELERSGAERNVSRCLEALDRDLHSLSNTTNDWASWDDTYRYVQDGNLEYEASNLVDETFSNAHLNLLCFLDLDRRVRWGEVRDQETLEEISVPDLFAALKDVSCPISTHDSVDDAATGILVTNQGPMLLASRPIITTKHTGPIRGTLIMGRFLNDREIKSIADRTQVKLEAWTIGQSDMPAGARRVLDNNPVAQATHIEIVDQGLLHAYRLVNDVYGKPAILMRVEVPREVTAQGRVAAKVATAVSVVGGAVTLAVMWVLLQRGVVDPLRRMVDHVVLVGQTGDLKMRLGLTRTDEIGMLANEFDRMAEHLSSYRKKVLDSAHRAGMEEVASEVLHNVGNAVNSASCSIEMLRERLGESKAAGLDRATAMLREQAPRAGEFFTGDPRGPKLIKYLIDVNEALKREQIEQQADVTRLFETIRHIRDVISAQQSYTGESDFRQEVALASLVDEVLLLNQEQLQSARIEVQVDLPPLPDLRLNKSKTTQVLVNLVRNAIQAMQNEYGRPRVLTISAQWIDEAGIEIEVTDTGHGFDEQTGKKLFAHGFTTKTNGNGFGLHYCANAVQGVGGHISAESAGPGLGATFRVRLVDVVLLNQTILA